MPGGSTFGGKLLVAPPHVAIPVNLDGLEGLTGDGDVSLQFDLPFDPRLVGLQVNAQGLLLDLASAYGVAVTEGLEMVIQ